MKKLLCLLGGALLLLSVHAQKIKPFSVDDLLPDIPFDKLLFYKDSIARLSDFTGKLVLLDFWFTRCSTCIEMFPRVDSLQRQFGKRLQVIMVTRDPKERVVPLIQKWEKLHHIKWTLPIVVNDTLLHLYFPHHAEPNYIWIAPESRFVAQTSYFFLRKEIMESYLSYLPDEIYNSGYSVDSLYKK